MFSQLDVLLVGIVVLGIFKVGLTVIYKGYEARPFEKLPLMVNLNDRPGLEQNLADLKKRLEPIKRLNLILGIAGPMCAGIATIAIGFFYIYKVNMIWAWIMAGIGISGVGLLLAINTVNKLFKMLIERIHQRLQNMPG
jgi:hypothetical protein